MWETPFHHFSPQGIPNLWARDGGRRGPETGESLFPPSAAERKSGSNPFPTPTSCSTQRGWKAGRPVFSSFLWGWAPPSAPEAFKAKAGQGLGGQEVASSGEDQHLAFHWTGRKFGFRAEKMQITNINNNNNNNTEDIHFVCVSLKIS